MGHNSLYQPHRACTEIRYSLIHFGVGDLLELESLNLKQYINTDLLQEIGNLKEKGKKKKELP
jgi:hypothetical protein